MTLPRRVREILLVAGLLIVPALLLRTSAKAPAELSFFDRGLLRVTAPLQLGLMGMLRGVSDTFSRYALLVSVKSHNEALLRENEELRRQVKALQLASERSERLERLLAMRNEILAETAAARVVAVETSPTSFRVLRVRIDRGASEVRTGMPVLAASGVVGRVARTYGPYSEIVLATDSRSSIDVVLPRIGSRGVLKGTGEDSTRCRIDYLLRQDEVKVGDQVVTSGLLSIFPADVPVGRVVAIRKQSFGLYQEVEVEPAVDFSKLREVLIVLAPPPPPDPDAGKRVAESARGVTVPR